MRAPAYREFTAQPHVHVLNRRRCTKPAPSASPCITNGWVPSSITFSAVVRQCGIAAILWLKRVTTPTSRSAEISTSEEPALPLGAPGAAPAINIRALTDESCESNLAG